MAAGTLTIGTEESGGITILTVNGPVDSATFNDFKLALNAACNRDGSRALLDCKGLTYMNSKAFGLLSSYHRICLSTMGMLALCNLNRKIVKTMDLLGLGRMLKVYETREEALAGMKA